MEVDHTFKDKCKGKGKETKSDNPNKECFLCGKKGHFARTCWSRIHLDQMVNEVKGAKVDADAAEEFECTVDNTVKDVTMSQSGCESHEDGLVTIDSGASVNVCSKWFG